LKTRVLFLCTGNSARSQMAEAFLRRYAGARYEVHSAGLEPTKVNPLTRRVMAEVGYDLAGHFAKDLSGYIGTMHFGYLITVCAQADKHCPTVFPGMGKRLHWDLEDPAAAQGSEEENLAVFRRVRDEIDEHIKQWLAEQDCPVSENA